MWYFVLSFLGGLFGTLIGFTGFGYLFIKSIEDGTVNSEALVDTINTEDKD